MKESTFYDICEAAELIQEDVTNGYFPTIDEIDDGINTYGIEDQVSLLAYYASNPFKRMNNPLKDDIDYLDVVKYAKERLSDVELMP